MKWQKVAFKLVITLAIYAIFVPVFVETHFSNVWLWMSVNVGLGIIILLIWMYPYPKNKV